MKMISVKKIVISNIYSPKNIGDRAIVYGIVNFIKIKYPNYNITFLSKYYNEFKNFTDWDGGYELIHLPVDKNRLSTLLAPLWSLVKYFLSLFLYIISHGLSNRLLSKKSAFKIIAGAEFVFAAGGNYLFSSNKSLVSRTMLVHLLNIYLPTLLKKKVVVFPQSIGPFYRTYEKWLVCKLLKKVDLVMVRDRESYFLLLENGLDKNMVRLVPDIAFILSEGQEIKEDRVPKKVLLTVLDWSWGVNFDEKNRYQKIIDNYKNNFIKIIDHLTQDLHLDVVILAHVTVDTSNDLVISKEISQHTIRKVRVIDKSKSDIHEIISYYKEFDMVIGSRMHSCILSIGLGIPTIGVAYQPKTVGTFNLLNIPEYIINGNSFHYNQLKNLVDSIINNYENSLIKFQSIGFKALKEIHDIDIGDIIT